VVKIGLSASSSLSELHLQETDITSYPETVRDSISSTTSSKVSNITSSLPPWSQVLMCSCCSVQFLDVTGYASHEEEDEVLFLHASSGKSHP